VKEKPTYRAEDIIINNWEELTPKQVLQVVPHVFNDNSNEVALLHILFKNKKIFTKLSNEQVYDILGLTEWVSSTLFKTNLIQHFKHGSKTYYGPETGLGNVTLIEFAKADNFYLMYLKTKEERFLNSMIACLYRPSKLFWGIRKHFERGKDRRRKLNTDTIEEDASVFDDLKKELKQYVILFFMGCKESLYNTYYELFNSDDEGEKVKAPNEKSFGWAGIIYDLAETLPFAGLEKAKQANLHTALIYLNKKAIENLKALEKAKKTKPNENKNY
jgi:hypothetical protein